MIATALRCLVAIAAAVVLVLSTEALAQGMSPGLPVPDRPEIEVTPISINSASDDFAPAIVRGGRLMIFTSARSTPNSGRGDQRMFEAVSSDGRTFNDVAELAESVARGEHVGSASLTPDGNFMIFAAYRWEPADASQSGYGRTDLYSAVRGGGGWTDVTNLGQVVNSDAWDSHPTLSTDGRLLFFASDREGGYGGTDLYVSRLGESGWSAPVNLGPSINTPADELAPSIAPDGRSLFFASNGYGGVGGFDLFIATGGNQMGMNWGSVENMGTPINSIGDEYFWVSIPNSTDGFFSSDRGGDQDVYLAVPNPFPPEALVTVSGSVRDAASRRAIAAYIAVTDLTTGEVVANYRTDDRTGEYFVLLPRGRRYSITAESPGYIFYSDEYFVPTNAAAEDLSKDILLQPTSGGTTRLLVFFDYNKAELKSESMPDLRRAVRFLRNNPTVDVEIAGHTDSVGNDGYNQELSQRRANAVRSFFVENGVSASRLKAVGYGERQPAADNGTEEGRARNRRVELRVAVEIDGDGSNPDLD